MNDSIMMAVAAGLPSLVIGVIGFLAKNAFGNLSAALEKLDGKLDALTEKIDGHGNRIAVLETRFEALEFRLKNLEDMER